MTDRNLYDFEPAPPEFPPRIFFWILAVVFAAWIAIATSGCTAPKNMMARKDCDEKMRLVLAAMRARTDTFVVYHTDTIIRHSVRSDTVLKLDTLIHILEKERLKVQWQVIRDTMHIQAQCRTDTIYRTVAETTIKQGSTEGLAPAIQADTSWGWWNWLWLIISCCVIGMFCWLLWQNIHKNNI